MGLVFDSLLAFFRDITYAPIASLIVHQASGLFLQPLFGSDV